MEINLSKGIQLPTLPGAKGADFPVKKAAASLPQKPAAPAEGFPNAVDQKRQERVVQAAKAMFKDVFAVSDMRFSIFKDSSGQYITRYTSLRDGRVTYIPEPALLQRMERSQPQRDALVEMSV